MARQNSNYHELVELVQTFLHSSHPNFGTFFDTLPNCQFVCSNVTASNLVAKEIYGNWQIVTENIRNIFEKMEIALFK